MGKSEHKDKKRKKDEDGKADKKKVRLICATLSWKRYLSTAAMLLLLAAIDARAAGDVRLSSSYAHSAASI